MLVDKPIVLVLSPCPYLFTFSEAVTCSRVEYEGSSCANAVAEAPLFKNYQLSFWETPIQTLMKMEVTNEILEIRGTQPHCNKPTKVYISAEASANAQ